MWATNPFGSIMIMYMQAFEMKLLVHTEHSRHI